VARRHFNLVIDANGTMVNEALGISNGIRTAHWAVWVNANAGSRIYLHQTLAVVIGHAKADCAWRPGKALGNMLVSPNHNRPCQARAEHEDLAVINRKIEFSKRHHKQFAQYGKITKATKTEEMTVVALCFVDATPWTF
jgi:hypothetical protein